MKTILHAARCTLSGPRFGKNFVFAMAMALLLSGMLSPIMPVLNAITESQVAAAQRGQVQPVQPLQPLGQETVAPEGEESEGDEVPAEETETAAALEAEIPAEITINLSWCPIGTDLASAADGYSLQPLCDRQGPAVNVSLESTTGNSTPLYGSTGFFPGQIFWGNLPFDDWELRFNTAPISEEALFCQGFHSHGNTKPYGRYALSVSQQPGYPIDTLNDESITCDWFGELPESGILLLTKFNCPEGYDLATNGLQMAKTDCASAIDPGVTFEIKQDFGSGYAVSATTDPTFNNSFYLEGIPAGETIVTETVPADFALQAAQCEVINWQDPSQSTPSTQVTITNGTGFTLQVASASMLLCDVFDIAGGTPPVTEGGYGDIVVDKFECTTDIPMDADVSWYGTNCTTIMNGVNFVLDRPEPDTDVQTMTGDSTDGRVMFGGTAVGTYPLTEEVPAGYMPVAIFCATVPTESIPAPGDFQQMTPNGSTIDATVTADSTFYCQWFNAADGGMTPMDEGISLTIYKWECPQGTLFEQAHDYYEAECATEMAGVPFQVTDDNGTQDTTSDTNGRQIDGLVGQITIQEMVPDGYGQPAVFCKLLNDENTEPYGPQDASVTLPAATDDDYQCWFYNIPDDGTSVTIYKWECPEGTLPGQTHEYYEAECATEQAGVPFQVTDNNGTQDTTSDTNGRQIDTLYGQITIQEMIPDGYYEPAVFCKLLNDETSTVMTSANGLITLQPSSTDDWQCWFYNIPDDGTSVTIYKWLCPEGTMYGQAEDYYSAECATEQPGVPFQVTDDNGTQDTTSDTNGRQIDGLYGEILIQEMIPEGFGDPVVYCKLLNDENGMLWNSATGLIQLQPVFGDDWQCWFYNIPVPDSTVTIYKWECPQGSTPEPTLTWHQTNCVQPQDGVDFTLTDGKGPRMLTTTGGMVSWDDVAAGAFQVAETVPAGYSPNPFVYCIITPAGDGIAQEMIVTTVNGVWNYVVEPGTVIECYWYNTYLGPGEITVYKWTCPPGYDRTAWGADPMVDCTEATNGVPFTLNQPDPGVDLMSNTGDSINGAVYFGGLEPGDYSLTEIIIPDTLQDVFVWVCYGLNTSAVHPIPLNVGPTLDFTIAGGDNIVCHWFNVPIPPTGWMVVSKFNCTTETYVSDVYCYTNQTGQEFNLQMWVNGTGWVTVMSGITDVSGKVTFADLEPGAYQLIEPNTKACLMKSSNITSGGYLGVNAGEGTTVYVYNCKTPPPTPKPPTKYPNTGVAPSAGSEVHVMPGIEAAGLLGLLAMRLNRRRMLAGAGLVSAGVVSAALPLARAQELVPLGANPTPLAGTPEPAVFGCEATPAAWTQAESTPGAGTLVVDPCNRGAIPMHIRVPVIGVDAPIEYLEMIDGALQPPTGATDVTWYKETSRLGEVGNGIYAGHLNYWGVPEGVFFRLESLKAGDVIEIDGDNQQTYLYEVQWMQNFPSDEDPPQEALGFTDEVAITLITCGGEWVSSRAEYDHRTLVRAVQREG